MKKILFAAAFMLCCFSFKMASAQITFSLGVNIGNQPEWGPVGYDHADYYYMPDIDAYYDVNAHSYIYFNNNVWVRSAALPPRYAHYDMYHGYKVVINHPAPWRHAGVYRSRYARYRGRHNQTIIRDSRSEHYRNHWQGNSHQDNGRHYGDRNHDARWHGNGHDDHGHGHDHDDHGHGR